MRERKTPLNLKRKLICALLSIMVICSAMPLSLETADASSVYWTDVYYGGTSLINDDDPLEYSQANALVTYLQLKYKEDSYWQGGGQCYGYAVAVTNIFASSTSTRSWTGLENTLENFKKKVKGKRAGTHIRVSNGKSFNGASGHSFVYLGTGKNGTVYWADNNNGYSNQVHYYSGSWENFYYMYSGFSYLNRVTEPNAYKSYSSVIASGRCDNTGGTPIVSWLKVSGATSYKVYRSISKTGTYKLVGTVSSLKFKDTTAKAGTEYYYYVVAAGKKSNVISITAKLKTPSKINISYTNTGKVKLSWKTISGAAKYRIYRSMDGYEFVLVKTTTETEWVDPSTDGEPSWANEVKYAIKAVSAKGSVSNYCVLDGWIGPGVARPSFTVSAEGNEVTWEWAECDKCYYCNYRILYSRDKDKLISRIKSNTKDNWENYYDNYTYNDSFTKELSSGKWYTAVVRVASTSYYYDEKYVVPSSSYYIKTITVGDTE